MCQRLPAPAGAVRAEATPPDRPLSTNKKKIQMRNTRPASDFATESTAGVKATPPDNNPSKLKMSKSWPDPDFARESTASGSGSPGAQGLAAYTRRPRKSMEEAQVPKVTQQTRVSQVPEEDEKPEEEQKTHRIDMADWPKPPDPWFLAYDFTHGSPFYYNGDTHESRWTFPTES